MLNGTVFGIPKWSPIYYKIITLSRNYVHLTLLLIPTSVILSDWHCTVSNMCKLTAPSPSRFCGRVHPSAIRL